MYTDALMLCGAFALSGILVTPILVIHRCFRHSCSAAVEPFWYGWCYRRVPCHRAKYNPSVRLQTAS